MRTALLSEAQELQARPALFIKFASRTATAGPYADTTDDDYAALIDQIPDWSVRADGQVDTESGGVRPAWLLDRDGMTVAVVAHEDGPELFIAGVLALGPSIASGLATAAVIGLAKSMWERWKRHRAPAVTKNEKRDSSLIVERRDVHYPDGSVAAVLRIELPAPVSTDALTDTLTWALAFGDAGPTG